MELLRQKFAAGVAAVCTGIARLKTVNEQMDEQKTKSNGQQHGQHHGQHHGTLMGELVPRCMLWDSMIVPHGIRDRLHYGLTHG